MPRPGSHPQYGDVRLSDPKNDDELLKFTTRLEKVCGEFLGWVFHHQEGSMDLYPKTIDSRKPKYFTIAIASANMLDAKIKELNDSQKLFDEFVEPIKKEIAKMKI